MNDSVGNIGKLEIESLEQSGQLLVSGNLDLSKNVAHQ